MLDQLRRSMRPNESYLFRACLVLLALSLAPLPLHALAYSSLPVADFALRLVMLLPVFILLAAVTLSGLSVILAILEKRPSRLIALAVTVASVVILVLGGIAGVHIQKNAFASVSERGKPLIEAISRYSKDHGHPPTSLDVIAPSYMDHVPTTGLHLYPTFTYETGDAAQSVGNPWILSVETKGLGLFAMNHFFYYPKQNYAKRDNGGPTVRIGSWALDIGD